jgi:hypothetical protein
MANPTPLKPEQIQAFEMLFEATKTEDANAQRLIEESVRYIILANAGGIAACLTLAGGLLKDKAATIPISDVTGPMWLFLIGMIVGGLVVSLLRAQAQDFAEKHAANATAIIRNTGRTVSETESAFSAIERKGLPHVTLGIKVLALVGQLTFVAGAAWGLIEIGHGG